MSSSEKDIAVVKVNYLKKIIFLTQDSGYWKFLWKSNEFDFWDGKYYSEQEEALEKLKGIIHNVLRLGPSVSLSKSGSSLDNYLNQN